MQEYGTKRYIQIWTKRTKKLEDKILSIKNEIIGLQKTAVKNILNILITIGFLSLISFLVFYDIYILSGLKPAIVMVALFIGGLCMDSLVSNALMRKIVLVIIIAAFTTALGYSVLMRDLQRSNIQICAETDCFYLVRKIEKGYFVTNTTELLFLDNELNIKTRQKM